MVNGVDNGGLSLTQLGIKNLIIPSTYTKNGVTANVTKIEDYAFVPAIEEIVFHKEGVLWEDLSDKSAEGRANNIVVLCMFGVGGYNNSSYVSCLSSLTNVIVPNTIIDIGVASFTGCGNLKEIQLTNNITSIGMAAFMGCYSLTTINLPNTLTVLPQGLFELCTSLQQITIPSSVTLIGSGYIDKDTNNEGRTFRNCTSLTSVTFEDPTNWQVSATNLCGCSECQSWGGYTEDELYAKRVFTEQELSDKSIAAQYLVKYSLSDWIKVEEIEGNLPDSWIGYDSTKGVYFVQQGSATDFTANINSSNSYQLIIPSVYTRDGVTAPVTYMAETNHLFRKSVSGTIKSVVIPDTITNIPSRAFRDQADLSSVTIGSGVSDIGYSPFMSCSNITSIIISDSNPYFTDLDCNVIATKEGHSYYMDATSDNNDNKYKILPYTIISGSKVSTNIPTGIVSIGPSAFNWQTKLTSITIPSSVTTIQKAAFQQCKGLTNVNFENKTNYWIDSTNYLYLDMYNSEIAADNLGREAFNYEFTYSSTAVQEAYVNGSYMTLESAMSTYGNASSATTIYVMPNTRASLFGTIGANTTVIMLYSINTSDYNSDGTADYTGTTYSKSECPKGICTSYITRGDDALIINGTLNILGELTCGAVGSFYMGQTGGRYAKLHLSAVGSFQINGTLKCTGYLTGDGMGSISVNSNASVYLPFIVNDYRGGKYVLAAYNSNVSMFNQYQIINISAPLDLLYGAKLYGYANLYMSSTSSVAQTVINFVGNDSSYVFQLASGGSLSIDVSDDLRKCYMEFDGGMTLNPLSVTARFSILTQTLTTKNSHLPISWFFDITLDYGNYYFTKQNVKLMPGSRLRVGYSKWTALWFDSIVVLDDTYAEDDSLVQSHLNYNAGSYNYNNNQYGDAIFELSNNESSIDGNRLNGVVTACYSTSSLGTQTITLADNMIHPTTEAYGTVNSYNPLKPTISTTTANVDLRLEGYAIISGDTSYEEFRDAVEVADSSNVTGAGIYTFDGTSWTVS